MNTEEHQPNLWYPVFGPDEEPNSQRCFEQGYAIRQYANEAPYWWRFKNIDYAVMRYLAPGRLVVKFEDLQPHISSWKEVSPTAGEQRVQSIT